MKLLRASMIGLASAVSVLATTQVADASAVSSLSSSSITIYGAKWCGPCKSLEKGLTDRKIGFDIVDVDDNPSAFERAKAASGEGGAIPLTSVVHDTKTTWIVGADVDAVDRAQRGE